MTTRRRYPIPALRALCGVGADVSEDILRRIADILGVSGRGTVVRATLAEHQDLIETEGHLDEWYPMEDRHR